MSKVLAIILAPLACTLGPLGTAAAQGGALSFWMPPEASSQASEVDAVFKFIFAISLFFFLLIVVLLVVFIVKYRRRPADQKASAPSHSTAIELTWTIIPTIIVVAIFYMGFRSYVRMSVVPPDAYEIQVVGRMWNWSFRYPNGAEDNELHVPVHTPVRLVLSSEDVIHSLFIPAFRLKRDAVPGRYNKFWFEATRTGTFDVYCAEYCGTNHSTMLTKVIVHEAHAFNRWLEQAANWEQRMTPVDAGQMLTQKRGCLQCHSMDGSKGIGPSLRDVFGAKVTLADGSTVTADENYIRDSILYPQRQIVAGYNPVMASYLGSLKDRDIDAIIWYMKSSSRHYSGTFPQRLTTRPTTSATTQAAR